MLLGHRTWIFENQPTIISTGTVGGPFEANGRIRNDFDLLHDGNFGYHGEKKMINKIKKMHDVYIIVNLVFYHDDNPYNQFNKAIVKHVIDSYEKVDSWEDFAVYYKN